MQSIKAPPQPLKSKNLKLKTTYQKATTLLAVVGPGLIVMLADTDAGSIVTAAQSGAVWGYKLLALQFLLIPVLYVVQELTIRLGIATGKGQGELIQQYFGKTWARIVIGVLLICCTGALITELCGIVGVGNLFGITPRLSMGLTIAFLVLLVLTKSYTSIERIALTCGMFELVYVFIAWQSHPTGNEIIFQLRNLPLLHNSNYLYFAAANIGAVIMPWMIFYQQSAIVDKKLKPKHMKFARIETIVGAIITQTIMASIIIALAATIGKGTGQGAEPIIATFGQLDTNTTVATTNTLNTIEQISGALTPLLGDNLGRVLFALGMLGASLIATIVVLLTAAWSIGELTGKRHSLQTKPREAPWFYGAYFVILMIGGIVVSSNLNLVNLSVAVEVMNALALPLTLGFLFALTRKALPSQYKLSNWYTVVVGAIIFATCSFALIAAINGIIGRF
jgi:NRAMP (natural resistance-associated macrophage protein)-like metal ion transporter